jgi:ribosomal-protein-alanine N-acetyltransferase
MTVIRSGAAADLEALSSLERAAFGREGWSPRLLEEELDALGTGRVMLVAAAGARLVGYAALAYTEDTADLLRIAVNPDQHRQGIASSLCTAILDVAGQRGCTRVLLEVAADNSPALALYQRLGFAEIHRRPRYYRNGVAAVVMELPLAAPDPARPQTYPPARGAISARSAEGGPGRE